MDGRKVVGGNWLIRWMAHHRSVVWLSLKAVPQMAQFREETVYSTFVASNKVTKEREKSHFPCPTSAADLNRSLRQRHLWTERRTTFEAGNFSNGFHFVYGCNKSRWTDWWRHTGYQSHRQLKCNRYHSWEMRRREPLLADEGLRANRCFDHRRDPPAGWGSWSRPRSDRFRTNFIA